MDTWIPTGVTTFPHVAFTAHGAQAVARRLHCEVRLRMSGLSGYGTHVVPILLDRTQRITPQDILRVQRQVWRVCVLYPM